MGILADFKQLIEEDVRYSALRNTTDEQVQAFFDLYINTQVTVDEEIPEELTTGKLYYSETENGGALYVGKTDNTKQKLIDVGNIIDPATLEDGDILIKRTIEGTPVFTVINESDLLGGQVIYSARFQGAGAGALEIVADSDYNPFDITIASDHGVDTGQYAITLQGINALTPIDVLKLEVNIKIGETDGFGSEGYITSGYGVLSGDDLVANIEIFGIVAQALVDLAVDNYVEIEIRQKNASMSSPEVTPSNLELTAWREYFAKINTVVTETITDDYNVDCNNASIYNISFESNHTLSIINPTSGEYVTVFLKDTSGSYPVITWDVPTGYTLKFPNDEIPVTNDINVVDRYDFTCIGTIIYASVIQNYLP